MSRNIGSGYNRCVFCRGHISLEEAARPFSQEDGKAYYDEYKTMMVANANCADCNAKYLAWVVGNNSFYRGNEERVVKERGFFDLSHRSTFNDEPGEADLPDFKIVERAMTKEECQQLYVIGVGEDVMSGTIKLKTNWPVCPDTGKKIHHCYGCVCNGIACKNDEL